MMAKRKFSKFKEKLLALDQYAEDHANPHRNVIRSRSPSFNFAFGNGHGIPRGYTLLIGGPPKGGKSTKINDIIGQTQIDYPEGFIIKFDTEFREDLQLSPAEKKIWGIDDDRYQCYQTNDVAEIYDRINNVIPAMIDDGLDVPLIIIDSVNQIQGLRSAEKTSVKDQRAAFGDLARTLQECTKSILPTIRRKKIACIFTCHIGAELDPAEIMRGNKTRPKVADGMKHMCEYYAYIEPILGQRGSKDLLEQPLVYNVPAGLEEKKQERSGHRIRVRIKSATKGPVGRLAEFTYDYRHGIVNQHEEVFLLADNLKVFSRSDTNRNVRVFGDLKWNGKQATLKALEEDQELRAAVMKELYRRDLAGELVGIGETTPTVGDADDEDDGTELGAEKTE